MTYTIYNKALDILKSREDYYGNEAHVEGTSYSKMCSCLDRASAYNSAWWILYYAMHEDWDALDQYDYYSNSGDKNVD